jgi:hypothetical protein
MNQSLTEALRKDLKQFVLLKGYLTRRKVMLKPVILLAKI